MPPDPANPSPTTATADPGLPPVAPPSGKFILQLFLVPGLIVGVVVLLLLIFQWFFGGGPSKEAFLRGLRDSNSDVRWRTAEDLAQRLPRNEILSGDAGFALDLAGLLHQAIEENDDAEKAHAEKERHKKLAKPSPAPRQLQGGREHILFLIACLGEFQAPGGAPLLRDLLARPFTPDHETAHRGRANTALALAKLGNSLQQLDRQPPGRRVAIAQKLREEANDEEADENRRRWAREALACVEERDSGKPSRAAGIGNALALLADAPEPFLREKAALALAFWDGDQVEPALERLVADDGRGTDPVQREPEVEEYRKAHPDEVRRRNQKQISYTALLVLARRGSGRVKAHLPEVKEMLDLEQQRAIWQSEEPRQQGSAEAQAAQVVLETIQALNQLRRADPDFDLSGLKPSLDRLIAGDNVKLSTEARELKAKLP